jgi:hydroxymethylpyrimidine pyrophosphatase-like HAD family hydrolase
MKRQRVVAIDFDGTIVEDAWPTIGKLKPGALDVIKRLRDNGDDIVIWTCRKEKDLSDAIKFLDQNDIPYNAVNENVESIKLDFSPFPKIYYDVLIDDKNLGGVLPWDEIEKMLF